MSGQLTGIYCGMNKGAGKSPVEMAELLPGHGLVGDIHAGLKPHRQVSLFAAEILEFISSQGIEFDISDLSANLITQGLNLDSLPDGIRLVVGECILELSESRKPCGSLTRIDKRLPRAALSRCGKFARVIVGGTIRPGDSITIVS